MLFKKSDSVLDLFCLVEMNENIRQYLQFV